MAYETGTATDYRDLLTKLKTFLTTNATLVGLGQNWQALEHQHGTAVRHFTNSDDATLKNAFSDHSTAYWSPSDWAYAAVEFPSAVAISHFEIEVATNSNYAPKDFRLDFSDDGSIWTNAATFTGETWSGLPRKQMFATGVSAAELHKYWRFKGDDAVSGNELRLMTIKMYEVGDTSFESDLAGEDLLMLKGPGLSGTEEIFVGLRTYADADADYYNVCGNCFTGYITDARWTSQPGRWTGGDPMCPLWNQGIEYYFRANGQSFTILTRIETVYGMLHMGKFNPYATPSQYPLPLVMCGMYPTAGGYRYSSTTPEVMLHTNVLIRFVDGAWRYAECFPYKNHLSISDDYSNIGDAGVVTPAYNYNWRDSDGSYASIPIVMSDSAGVYGEMDNLYYISGFNNAAENTLTMSPGGESHIVWRNAEKTGFADYYSLELS